MRCMLSIFHRKNVHPDRVLDGVFFLAQIGKMEMVDLNNEVTPLMSSQ